MALPQDGAIVLVGRIDTVEGRSWAWAQKVLNDGSRAWEREWPSSGAYSTLTAVTEVTGGAVIAVGGAAAIAGRTGHAGLVVKLDASGSVAWTRPVLVGDSDAKVTSVASDGEGGVVIAGALSSGPSRWSLFVARGSSSGEVTGQRILGAGDGVHAIRRTDGDGYVLVTDDYNVIQLDRAGQIRWQQKIVGADAAVALRDGSVVVAHSSDDRRVEAIVLTRLDVRGEKAWERTNQGVCRTTGMWLRSDDEIIVVSEPCDDSEILSVIAVSNIGKELSSHRVQVRPGATANESRPGPLGSIIAAGMFLQDSGPNASKAWLFRSGPIRSLAK